jgi:hypothetical protein
MEKDSEILPFRGKIEEIEGVESREEEGITLSLKERRESCDPGFPV